MNDIRRLFVNVIDNYRISVCKSRFFGQAEIWAGKHYKDIIKALLNIIIFIKDLANIPNYLQMRVVNVQPLSSVSDF